MASVAKQGLHVERGLRRHDRRRRRVRRAGHAARSGRAMVAAIREGHAAADPPRRSSATTTPTTSTACRHSRRPGAEIWAHRKAQAYLDVGAGRGAPRAAAQRSLSLGRRKHARRAARPVARRRHRLPHGRAHVPHHLYSGGAHSPEDLMMYVEEDRLLFAGDLIFAGRVPFVGNADSGGWLKAMDRMIALQPAVVVPGHGPRVARRRARSRAHARIPRCTCARRWAAPRRTSSRSTTPTRRRTGRGSAACRRSSRPTASTRTAPTC